MGADLPLLLQPTCPVPDDRGIASLLALVTAVAGARRVELTLEPKGGATSATYVRGEGERPSENVRVDVGPDFEAHLHVDGAETLVDAELDFFSELLTSVLDRHGLAAQTSILRAALDTTSSSILLFDGRGAIVYANPPADRLLSLQTEDELIVEAEGEARRPLFALLCGLVEHTMEAPGPTAAWKGRLHTSDGRILACEVNRLPSQEMRADAVVVLLQPIGSEPEMVVDDFASAHGLSRREQEVLQLLVGGATTVAMADSLGISPHTVRDHLKNLYRKTGAGSRGELLGLLSRASTAAVSSETP